MDNNLNEQETNLQNNISTPSNEINSTNNQTNNNQKSNKILIVIIVILIIIVLIGAFYIFRIKSESSPANENTETPIETNDSSNTENNDEYNTTKENTELSNNWNDYTFSIKGNVLSLPLSYSDLSNASGFIMSSDVTESTIAKNYYTALNLFKDNKLALYTEIVNDTNDYLKYYECKVTRIGQTSYQVKNGADIVTFPGNLTVGMTMTKEQLIDILGDADDIKNYNTDNYNKDTYKYIANKTWTTTNYYQISIVNGVIDELTLDNR